jgi:uncharacterized membrane protein YhaH (DUF805 family)
VNFTQAITSGFSNYVNFSGRAIRSEYWFWILFSIIGQLFNLAAFLPSIAVAVRRLHDLDRSGWWILLIFLPLIGAVVLIVWYCTRGTEGPNQFGPDPLTGAGAVIPRPAV